MTDLGKKVVTDCGACLKNLSPDVPADFEWDGQTFDERCEAWVLHAVEELEDELERYVRDQEDNLVEVPPQGDEDDD
jgi:hypothetical protein